MESSCKHLQKSHFFEWLTPLILSGEKTITIRDHAESHYVPGTRVDVFTLENHDYVCQIDILKVEKIHYSDINEMHAAQEHLPLERLKTLIKEIYPNDDEFYVISFNKV